MQLVSQSTMQQQVKTQNHAASPENPLARRLKIKDASPRPDGVPDSANDVGAWRSLVARLVRDEEAVGSNPAAPTIVWEHGIKCFGINRFR